MTGYQSIQINMDEAEEQSPKKLLNIINVYAPTTELVKKDTKLLDSLYDKHSTLANTFKI